MVAPVFAPQVTHLLLTEPASPVCASRYPEELYERAREALLAL